MCIRDRLSSIHYFLTFWCTRSSFMMKLHPILSITNCFIKGCSQKQVCLISMNNYSFSLLLISLIHSWTGDPFTQLLPVNLVQMMDVKNEKFRIPLLKPSKMYLVDLQFYLEVSVNERYCPSPAQLGKLFIRSQVLVFVESQKTWSVEYYPVKSAILLLSATMQEWMTLVWDYY